MTALGFISLTPLNKAFRLVITYSKPCLLPVFVALSIFLLSGCPSKAPVATTPAPPPPPAPTASIEAVPSTVKSGEPVVITWKTENATDVNIDPVGSVSASGSKTITPGESTTYHLTAKGPGGVQQSDARITVVAASVQPTSNESEEGDLSDATTRLDVFFDTDDYSIRPGQIVTIGNDADFLKEHPEVHIVVEGHCDEMGSTEYNLALGDRRAAEVRTALEKAGISPDRMRVISYGKEHQFCHEEADACWKMNRRAHIAPDLER